MRSQKQVRRGAKVRIMKNAAAGKKKTLRRRIAARKAWQTHTTIVGHPTQSLQVTVTEQKKEPKQRTAEQLAARQRLREQRRIEKELAKQRASTSALPKVQNVKKANTVKKEGRKILLERPNAAEVVKPKKTEQLKNIPAKDTKPATKKAVNSNVNKQAAKGVDKVDEKKKPKPANDKVKQTAQSDAVFQTQGKAEGEDLGAKQKQSMVEIVSEKQKQPKAEVVSEKRKQQQKVGTVDQKPKQWKAEVNPCNNQEETEAARQTKKKKVVETVSQQQKQPVTETVSQKHKQEKKLVPLSENEGDIRRAKRKIVESLSTPEKSEEKTRETCVTLDRTEGSHSEESFISLVKNDVTMSDGLSEIQDEKFGKERLSKEKNSSPSKSQEIANELLSPKEVEVKKNEGKKETVTKEALFEDLLFGESMNTNFGKEMESETKFDVVEKMTEQKVENVQAAPEVEEKTESESVAHDTNVKHKKKRNRRADIEQRISENDFVEGNTHDLNEDEASGEFKEIVGKRKKKKGRRQESDGEGRQPVKDSEQDHILPKATPPPVEQLPHSGMTEKHSENEKEDKPRKMTNLSEPSEDIIRNNQPPAINDDIEIDTNEQKTQMVLESSVDKVAENTDGSVLPRGSYDVSCVFNDAFKCTQKNTSADTTETQHADSAENLKTVDITQKVGEFSKTSPVGRSDAADVENIIAPVEDVLCEKAQENVTNESVKKDTSDGQPSASDDIVNKQDYENSMQTDDNIRVDLNDQPLGTAENVEERVSAFVTDTANPSEEFQDTVLQGALLTYELHTAKPLQDTSGMHSETCDEKDIAEREICCEHDLASDSLNVQQLSQRSAKVVTFESSLGASVPEIAIHGEQRETSITCPEVVEKISDLISSMPSERAHHGSELCELQQHGVIESVAPEVGEKIVGDIRFPEIKEVGFGIETIQKEDSLLVIDTAVTEQILGSETGNLGEVNKISYKNYETTEEITSAVQEVEDGRQDKMITQIPETTGRIDIDFGDFQTSEEQRTLAKISDPSEQTASIDDLVERASEKQLVIDGVTIKDSLENIWYAPEQDSIRSIEQSAQRFPLKHDSSADNDQQVDDKGPYIGTACVDSNLPLDLSLAGSLAREADVRNTEASRTHVCHEDAVNMEGKALDAEKEHVPFADARVGEGYPDEIMRAGGTDGINAHFCLVEDSSVAPNIAAIEPETLVELEKGQLQQVHDNTLEQSSKLTSSESGSQAVNTERAGNDISAVDGHESSNVTSDGDRHADDSLEFNESFTKLDDLISEKIELFSDKIDSVDESTTEVELTEVSAKEAAVSDAFSTDRTHLQFTEGDTENTGSVYGLQSDYELTSSGGAVESENSTSKVFLSDTEEEGGKASSGALQDINITKPEKIINEFHTYTVSENLAPFNEYNSFTHEEAGKAAPVNVSVNDNTLGVCSDASDSDEFSKRAVLEGVTFGDTTVKPGLDAEKPSAVDSHVTDVEELSCKEELSVVGQDKHEGEEICSPVPVTVDNSPDVGSACEAIAVQLSSEAITVQPDSAPGDLKAPTKETIEHTASDELNSMDQDGSESVNCLSADVGINPNVITSLSLAQDNKDALPSKLTPAELELHDQEQKTDVAESVTESLVENPSIEESTYETGKGTSVVSETADHKRLEASELIMTPENTKAAKRVTLEGTAVTAMKQDSSVIQSTQVKPQRRSRERVYKLLPRDIQFCVRMIEKYGENYEGMAADPGNTSLDTAKGIARKIRIFKESPQYEVYLKDKTELENGSSA